MTARAVPIDLFWLRASPSFEPGGDEYATRWDGKNEMVRSRFAHPLRGGEIKPISG